MSIRTVTRLVGLGFIAVGILGFFPGTLMPAHMEDPLMSLSSGYGRLFGLFPVNVLHNLVHLIFGIWGVIASADVITSRKYCRFNAVFYGALVICGIIPGLNTLFGTIPVFSHDIWLHGVIAAVTGYYGFARPASLDLNRTGSSDAETINQRAA
jgi:hypothetical protein